MGQAHLLTSQELNHRRTPAEEVIDVSTLRPRIDSVTCPQQRQATGENDIAPLEHELFIIAMSALKQRRFAGFELRKPQRIVRLTALRNAQPMNDVSTGGRI
jgi:hypothetical protein